MDIFLKENNSALSTNAENVVNIDFTNKNRLLPDENLVDNFSLYEQYIKERDECEKYRLILNINSICSNVLFNTISEIVINEGGGDCKCLNFGTVDKSIYAENAVNTTQKIDYNHAIRDTEYSHTSNGGFVYHCGIDIFNNHMLRKQNFMHINKIANGDTKSGKVYNTIGDYLRDENGKIVNEHMSNSYTTATEYGETLAVERHVYNTDSLLTLKNAFYERCNEENGWWGFTNPNMINMPTGGKNSTNGEEISVNEMMANNKPCEFIDLYPDRSLFTFVPKYNKKRKRIEKNWDYCITYPYAKDFDIVQRVCGGEDGTIRANAKIVINSNGTMLLQCTSRFKHTFSKGSYVTFYYYVEREGELVFQMFDKKIMVVSVGDLNGKYKNRIFSVKFDDVDEINEELINYGCYYKKNVNNTECSYYARIFKKIKKIEIKKGQTEEKELLSDINKTAFSKNIYGDDIAQIVFTDNIDLTDLKDENGRDVSEIYFTVVKKNSGYIKWYRDKKPDDDKIEMSHCFGEVTSGIDFSGVDLGDEPFDYNVHYLHNLDENVLTSATFSNTAQAQTVRNTFSAWGDTILNGMPECIERDITSNCDEYYGDIVEFDNYTYETHVIANIYHRFNTAQRELFDNMFRDMTQDLIIYDDYETANLGRGFKVETYFCNDILNSFHEYHPSTGGNFSNNDISTLMFANIMPEGYFYNPHTRIKIKEESTTKHSKGIYINYDECEFSEFINLDKSSSAFILKVRVPDDYGFIKGDYIALYDKEKNDTIWGTIFSYNDLYLSVLFNAVDFGGEDISNHISYFLPMDVDRKYFMFWTQDSVPIYAKFSLGTKEFSWKQILNLSEVSNKSELYDIPFTNGCLYIQKNINFYLKRQDPLGEYGLSYPFHQRVFNPLVKYIMNGDGKFDTSRYEYFDNNGENECY